MQQLLFHLVLGLHVSNKLLLTSNIVVLIVDDANLLPGQFYMHSVSPTTSPSVSPTESPTPAPSILINHINSKRSLIEKHILKSYTNDGATAYPSIRYTFDPFVRSLQTMGVDGFGGDDIPHRFLLWDTDPVHYRYGLANVAAFLAQAAVEAIYDDTCDELNWQQVAGRYAVSNSCGQEGRSYQDETCGKYSCLVDPAMEVTAIHAANDVRAPPPFECRPRVGVDDFAGYWDTNSGSEVRNTPYSNTAGRIDVEGCCYWGRGALLTRGSCNIGKLNYYLGARAAREGRPSLYPDVDFCADPEATCASGATEELRWTTAMFEWSERVQRYNSTGWDYKTELYKFLDGGMTDDSFIDTVSKAFVLGCHTTKCSKNQVRHADDRKSMFFLIVNEIFVLDSIPKLVPTSRPTRRVIPRPQTGSTPQQQQQQQPPSSVSNPTDLTPQPVEIPILSPQKPNLPPSGSTATPNRPQFVTPMPVVYVPNGQPTGNVNMPNTQPSLPNRQPPASNPGSEQQQQQQHANTYWPTYSENIIPLEGNGAGHRLSVCFFGIAIAGAIHLVFIP